MGQVDLRMIGEDRDTFHDMLQLSDIAGPIVIGERLDGRSGEGSQVLAVPHDRLS